MEVDCEGCAGCCLDWRPLADGDLDHERRGPRRPLDDTYNLAPLTRDEVRAFLAAGHADAMTPRLFHADDGPSVTVGGVELAAVAGRPAFLVGLRKVPKPVAPFDADSTWLPSCVFLDAETLQCRIHGGDLYPETCAGYPGENLTLGVETECERVEAAHGGDRLLDDEPPDDATPTFGPGAVGTTVFAHPEPDEVAGAVERIAAGRPRPADRYAFLAVAAGSSPGTVAVDDAHREEALEQARDADGWVGDAVEAWMVRAGEPGSPAPDPGTCRDEDAVRGAPGTPGWDGGDALNRAGGDAPD